MDFLEGLGAIPAALIPAAIIFYFQNLNNIRWMEERKQIAEAVLAERKERNAWQESVIERQFAKQDRTTEVMSDIRNEIHATKNNMTVLTLKIDNVLLRLKGTDDSKTKSNE